MSNGSRKESRRLTAETLFEAIALAVGELKTKTISTPPSPETKMAAVVLRKPAEHIIRLKRVHEWAQFSNTLSLIELLGQERLRKMLIEKT